MHELPACILAAYEMMKIVLVAVFTPDGWEAARRVTTLLGVLNFVKRLRPVDRKRKPKRTHRKGKR
ncbi:MAG: hypothetical protein EON60_05440 [Alphaproteobacteria bacterium]|nr:MAG: hypothetical protein EON60_05440 [Alphaproteobacteria bacterium]